MRITRDRTRRRRAPSGGRTNPRRGDALQRRLEDSEARYRALVRSLPCVTYVAALDVQAAFTFISPQVETLLGYKPEDWIADRGLWLKRMLPEDRKRILPELGRSHLGGKRFVAEYRLLDRSGKAKWILDESEVVRDEAGRPLFLQGTWTDITARKRRDEEVESLSRALSSSSSELKQLISVASHELKTPLRNIANLGEILARRTGDRLDADARGFIQEIRSSAAAAQKLMAGVVEYGELNQEAALSAVSLDAAAQRALGRLAKQIRDSGALVTRAPLPQVWAEPARLERVLYHLIENAIKFRSEEPPRIHISAERVEGRWVVSVRDNGVGLHQRETYRIFSIFERLHPRGVHSGVGLGLALCKKIVERFGGRIWVESEPGEGSTFRFSLGSPPPEGA
jgi:PAS domain S-box-containing protein